MRKFTALLVTVIALLLTGCVHRMVELPDGTKYRSTAIFADTKVADFLAERTGQHTGKISFSSATQSQQEALRVLAGLPVK